MLPIDLPLELDDELVGDAFAEVDDLEGVADTVAPMSEDELLAMLDSLEQDAQSFMDADLSDTRATVLDYFFGQPFGNEEEGRSQAISTDVMDGILGMLPDVLEPFVSSDQAVEFEPENEEDEDSAEQETQYISKVLDRNDRFALLYQWVLDGLLQVNGIVEYAWTRESSVQLERYEGLTDDQLTMLAQDRDVQIEEHRAYPDQLAPPPPPQGMPGPMGALLQPPQAPAQPMLHDVRVRRTAQAGRAIVVNVPPEEFRITSDATSWNPKKATMCGRVREVTLSQLRQMGFDVADDLEDTDRDVIRSSPEWVARHADSLATGDYPDDDGKASRKVVVRDMYPLIDWDGDGIAERRRILRVGRQILLNEEVEEPPFCSWSPYLVPHRWQGLCPGEQLLDVQLQKSTMVRQTFDSIYQSNTGRFLVARGVNWDDLLSNPVGGYVRTEADTVSDKLAPIPSQSVGNLTLPMLEYLDAAKESRVGHSKQASGLDANAIRQMTAFGAGEVVDAAKKRVRMIARTFAETGLRDLMISLHGLCVRNASRPDVIKLRGRYVPVDPRNWRTRATMTANVGLGSGSKQVTLQAMQFLLMAQKEALQVGLTDKQRMYNALAEATRALGLKAVHKFWIDPREQGEQQEPPRQPPPEVMAAQINAQAIVEAEQIKAQSGERKAARQDETKYLIALLEQATKALIEASKQDDAVELIPQEREVQGEMTRLMGGRSGRR